MKCGFKVILVILLFLGTIMVRWVDCRIIWELGKKQFHESPHLSGSVELDYISRQTEFLGYSSYQNALDILKKEIMSDEKQVVVVSYYNLIYPSVYLCYNKIEGKAYSFSLPWWGKEFVGDGLTEFYFLKSDRMIIERPEKRDVKITMVLGSLFMPYLKESPDDEKFKPRKDGNKLVFPMKFSEGIYYPMMSSKILKKIYIFYFYFPLISILFLTLFYSKKILISLSYYFIAPIIFNPLYFLFVGGTFWKELLKGNFFWKPLPFILILIATIITYYLFVKGIKYAIKVSKADPMTFTEKGVIAFFLFLLVIFRF